MKINPIVNYRHLMAMTTLLDLDSAQLSIDPTGAVTVDDPGSPLLITIQLDQDGRISTLTITARHPTARINQASISRLPITQMQRLAATLTTAAPDETWWTASAALKPAARVWPDDHWTRVLAVCAWARKTRRPGGAAQAIADLWGVTRNPTAYRWIRKARNREARRLTEV